MKEVMITDQKRIDEIQARCEAATPGGWRTPPTFSAIVSQNNGDIAFRCKQNKNTINDFLFITHAREDIPALLEDRAALQAEVAKLRARIEQQGKESCEFCEWRHKDDTFYIRDDFDSGHSYELHEMQCCPRCGRILKED